ncbi:hypothetical protein [Cerasicoccus fimbriatus]|uniref:hypothetical protein n=1 Tax=Cerasicoccus fimbriatus TaxID=3014554 RepID=UPI0022B4DCA5|nr:hypothetical protein [Cerasicoccus sp. TK19100]
MKQIKIALCTFTAVWLPVQLLGPWLGISAIESLVLKLGDIPRIVALAGLIWIAIDLWQSRKTQDEKIWWTVLGVIFAPITVPAYWFSYGLPRATEGRRPEADTPSDNLKD